MATQTRGTAAEKPAKSGRPAKKSERTTPAVFLRQVITELRKVLWPTRKELVTYTTVAIVFILVMMGLVTGLDTGFTWLVTKVFGWGADWLRSDPRAGSERKLRRRELSAARKALADAGMKCEEKELSCPSPNCKAATSRPNMALT